MTVAISVVVVASLLCLSSGCNFPAIYNFGDSNSDTGSVSAAFGRVRPPYGETFFGRPSGRFSDGRLIIDFITDELKLPFMSAYLDAIESNFRHGADFGAASATIQAVDGALFGAGISPISLDIQLSQFEQLKGRTNDLYEEAKNPDFKDDRLPSPEEFSKALYMLDIGQNDLSYGLLTTTEELVKVSVPNLISRFAAAIQKLYDGGARIFWIHNTGPIGCLPLFLIKNPPNPENADPSGCIKSYNEVAQEFNKQLKDMISQLRVDLLGAKLIYVDIYSAKYSLISEANKYGFVGTTPIYCCGKHLGNYTVLCGRTAVVNGTQIFGASCGEPTKQISWDGVHYTDAANRWVANRILDGSFSDPQVPITKACL